MASSQPNPTVAGKKRTQMPTASLIKPKRERTVVERRIKQNFLLIWLDAHIDESNSDFHESLTKLRAIVDSFDIFTDVDRCLNYMNRIKDEKIFLIVSGAFGEHLVPRIHQMPQVDSIFVFCGNQFKHEQWAKKWAKVIGVFTKMKHICEALQQAARQCDRDTIGISCIPMDSNASNLVSNQVDQSFMYTQLLKEALLDIRYEEQAVHDLASFCRQVYQDNPQELKNATKFEQEYGLKSPIWWYTYESFLYKTLNRALRNLEVDILVKMGFFIRDLHHQITQLHAQRSTDPLMKQPFIVYRGQALSDVDFEKIKRMPGGLMSFNNFLSTSRDEEKSLEFVLGSTEKAGMVGVMFKIRVDPSIPSAPYIPVSKWSAIPAENEILFSTHTVFHIGEITRRAESKKLYQINLTLTNDNDQQLSLLTDQLRKETFAELQGWDRLGPLLWKLGEYEQAESLYKMFLEQKPNDLDRSQIYHMLATIKSDQGEFKEALEIFERSLELRKKLLPADHIELACSYNNIGNACVALGEFSRALSSHEKALEINQKCAPIDNHALGRSYINIGWVYQNLRELHKALVSYEKALEIWSKILASNHFDLAKCYTRIGSVYLDMNDYGKAFTFQQKALEISRSVLPSNHPGVASAYYDMGFVYEKMGNFAEALAHYEKSLKIREKILPSHHMDLGQNYNSIGLVYEQIGELSKSIPFYQKAIEILEMNLPADHIDLGESYNSIGIVYNRMNQYSEALRLWEMAMSIFEKNLPPGHPVSGSSYNNIGFLCYQMGNYTKALSCYDKALEIRKNVKPPNQSDLADTYKNIGLLYETMSKYTQALPFYEKALNISKEILPPTSLELVDIHDTMGRMYEEIGDCQKAVSYWERAIDIAQRSLPPTHPIIRAIKKNIEYIRKKT